MADALTITQAESRLQLAQIREVFLEYAASLNFSLCFQAFDKELASLPGDYARPNGRLLFGSYRNELAGCVALHKLSSGICEMKRLYVRPQLRGNGFGRALAESAIKEARSAGYQRMRLDTVEPLMKDAVSLYRFLGFSEIAPYCSNPIAGALYMELQL